MEFGVAWDRKDPAKIGLPYPPKFRISDELGPVFPLYFMDL
jgi:hypothetical protein